MININQLENNFNNLLQNDEYIKLEMNIGKLSNNSFNRYINRKSVNIFKKFLQNKKYKQTNFQQNKYYYKNLILINQQNKQKCIEMLPNSFYNYYVKPFKNKETSNIQINTNNYIDNDIILFPFLEKYDYIENNHINQFLIKYKNSEIKLNIINNTYIKLNSSIDLINLKNFIVNINYILSKFYFIKL